MNARGNEYSEEFLKGYQEAISDVREYFIDNIYAIKKNNFWNESSVIMILNELFENREELLETGAIKAKCKEMKKFCSALDEHKIKWHSSHTSCEEYDEYKVSFSLKRIKVYSEMLESCFVVSRFYKLSTDFLSTRNGLLEIPRDGKRIVNLTADDVLRMLGITESDNVKPI